MRAREALELSGFRMIEVWECEIRRDAQKIATKVARRINKNAQDTRSARA